MFIAQYYRPPNIVEPRIRQPYVRRANYSAPRVYAPVIRQPISASFIVSLPVSISPGRDKGCFDATATNTTDSAVAMYKVIGITPQGASVSITPQGSIQPGKTERFTFCNLAALSSVQFVSNRSF